MTPSVNPSRKLKKANEAAGSGPVALPTPLFDEFWREGELAILFGPAGAGKSLMAVSLGESLARGRAVSGLQMPHAGRGVLYVDLVLSDGQFAVRYSCEGREGERRIYPFSEKFYRDRPGEGEDLIEWLREVVSSEQINVVIIDDLALVSESDDGTRQTLRLIRSLRRLTRELGISALVLADSQAPAYDRDTAERDLRRARVLCSYADSVFAISPIGRTNRRSVWQTRSQADEIAWTERSPAEFEIIHAEDGLIRLDYIEYELEPDEIRQICQIKRLHDEGKSFRTIAAELEISKSKAARLHAEWLPDFEQPTPPKPAPAQEPALMQSPAAPVQKPAREQGLNTQPEPIAAHHIDRTTGCTDGPGEIPCHPAHSEHTPDTAERPAHSTDAEQPHTHAEPAPTDSPRALTLDGTRFIEDLERELDGYGREIFIESRQEHGQRPKTWYQQRPKTTRWARFESKFGAVFGSDVVQPGRFAHPVSQV